MSEFGARLGNLRWLWISVVVIALDQLTKIIATQTLQMHQPVAVFPLFNFTLAHNTGAAFSFLSEAGGWQRWFFTLIAIVVSTVIAVWLKRLRGDQVWLSVALTLILGGAIGNVWDRMTLGYVIDFLDFYYGDWHWPAFNVADSAITVGAIMLAIDALFLEKARARAESGS
jgi:signal peptidase II